MPDAIGRYRVERVLGAGAFATVYLAHDPVLDAEVAVKLLAPQHAADPDVRARFIDEARTMRRLDSDRLVAVHDIGEHESQPFFVMPALRSGTLRDRLAEATELTTADVERVTTDLAACLNAVHAGGVVHRDVTPANVLIDGDAATRADELLGADERLVLGDFGIARAADRTAVTVGGGTVGYMAPEQGRVGYDIDHRADIFAATQIVDDMVRLAEPSVATRMAPEIDRGRAANPDQRPSTADEWRDELLGSLRGASRSRERPRDGVTQPAKRPTNRPALVFVGLLVVALAAIAAAIVASRGGDDDTPARPRIVGPEELLLGDSAEYTHEERDGSTYEWTLPDGSTSDSLTVTVTAETIDGVTISLAEDDGRTEYTNSLTVEVRSP